MGFRSIVDCQNPVEHLVFGAIRGEQEFEAELMSAWSYEWMTIEKPFILRRKNAGSKN